MGLVPSKKQSMIVKKLIISLIIITGLIPANILRAQTYLYFQDSPSAGLYDYSWMELTAPSLLERTGTDLRRFPVESTLPPQQGLNSLRLHWTSVSGGNWVAIAAGINWQSNDISQTDTLSFWLNAVDALNAIEMPQVFMEDVNNTKTTFHNISAYCPETFITGVWVRIAVPMNLFLNQGDPVDFTKIKTIGFAQNGSDGVSHTLLIDDMRVFAGNGTSPQASKPTGVIATGYSCHIEVSWNPNPETFINGYLVQRSLDGGSTFTSLSTTDANTTSIIDWVLPLGETVSAIYRVQAYNTANELSEPSDPASGSTQAMSDDEYLDMVQKATFRYFYDFAHPSSGMAKERNTSGNTITTGGSGFGVMALLVGIDRGYITRQQGIARFEKILTFLENADRFHGVWPHWLDGNTGHVIPFSTYDNGGDLVETAFLVEGLLTARQYFNQATPEETAIVNRIKSLWETVEWDWYSRNNSGVLYWHWSPNYGWQMNMAIRGWNEAAIIYLLAMASPTHAVAPTYWTTGWAGASYYLNGKSFYGYTLDVGWDKGGPLFFAHYSFIGFDPRHKKDQFTNYFILNRNHTLINRAYCIQNPLGHEGYGYDCWGLTASDDPDGYMAHEPTSSRDNGTITPTAALSSMPYTPVESLSALKYMYRTYGDKIWSTMGFTDAFNPRRNWYATSTLAIDQGPIIDMIENYRSQLLWNNFMANPEIAPMLEAVGFVYDPNGVETAGVSQKFEIYPNPVTYASDVALISFKSSGNYLIEVRLITGQLCKTATFTGPGNYLLPVATLNAGVYVIKASNAAEDIFTGKLIVIE